MNNRIAEAAPLHLNHDAGTVTSAGKTVITSIATVSAIRNGMTPRITPAIGTLATPQTTFSTVPTGGVSRPMELLMMNRTPKYTGSMPAATTTGINTGVRISTVGTKSSAVPTTSTSAMIASISSVLSAMNGCTSLITSPGKSATVISQEATMEAATRNITTLVVFAALMKAVFNSCQPMLR